MKPQATPLKVELISVKYAEFASEETPCFHADIYIDGEKAGTVGNEGRGAANRYWPPVIKEQLDGYAKTLPNKICEWLDEKTGKPQVLEQDADLLVDSLLDEWLLRRDLKRTFAKRILFTKKGCPGIFETEPFQKARLMSLLADINLMSKIKGCEKILNLLPIDEAVTLYREKGRKR